MKLKVCLISLFSCSNRKCISKYEIDADEVKEIYAVDKIPYFGSRKKVLKHL